MQTGPITPSSRFLPRAAVTGVVAWLALLGGSACSQNPRPAGTRAAGADMDSRAPVAETGGASLRPGDAVKVEIWREPDLSGTFEVGEDGRVVFPLLGSRDVSGVASDSLQRELVAEYRKYVDNPSVKVTPLRRIAILGEVQRPGLYPVDATLTLSDALALAGGVSANGNSHDIRLIREGQVIRRSMEEATVVGGSAIRSGDQIVVGQRSWFSRNIVLVSSLIGAAASVGVAFIIR